MRILLANDTYPPDVNGSAYFTKRLAEGLVLRGHGTHVLAASTGRRTEVVARDGVVEHRLRSLPVPFHRDFRFSPPPLLYRRVLREMKRIRPDVVHAQGHFLIGRAVIRAAKELGVPLVATNHFMPDNLVFYLELPEGMEKTVTDLAWRDFARVFDQADVVTAPTSFAAELAEEKGLKGPVLPISNGMDLSRFSPANDGDAFKREYGIADRPTLMYVGRLDAEKRVDELIRAVAQTRRSVDAQLVVVGAGHERRSLEGLAAKEGVGDRVVFTGFVGDDGLPGAYAAADVFVNAGIAELQSLVTLEAMATGKPVVAADAGALPLLVRDGANGYLFEPGDVADLAARLTGIFADERKREEMGEESLRIAARHDAGETLDAFEDLYAMVTRPGRAPREEATDPQNRTPPRQPTQTGPERIFDTT